MTRKLNIPAALYLSMIALAAAAPTSAQAFAGVGLGGPPPKPSSHKGSHNSNAKAKYIKFMDAICRAGNTALAPVQAQIITISAEEATVPFPQRTVQPLREALSIERSYIQRLRAQTRPRGNETQLIGFLNAEINNGNALESERVAINNEEAAVLTNAVTELKQTRADAKAYAKAYGFKVCGQGA